MLSVLFRVAALHVLFGVICASPACSQNAQTNHAAILRRDPSTSSPVLDHLPVGERLMLVDSRQDNGFYHVRTEDDNVGWVFAKFVAISQPPPVTPPTPPVTPPPTTPPTTPVTPTAPPTSPVTPPTAPPTTPVTPPNPPANPPPTIGSTACDPTINAHVYHPARLIVRQDCIALTGTIVDATANERQKEPDGVRHEADGDSHGWLKVDPGFESLLNAGNINDEGGNLVFEIICRYPITQADAKAACVGYTDQVKLPPVGSHVTIVGRFVQDSFHAQWNEIHPVTSITVTPQ